jgi:hypothetical protein
MDQQNEFSSRNNIDKVIQAYHSHQRAANAVEISKIKESQSNHKRSGSYQQNNTRKPDIAPEEGRASSKQSHKRPKSNAD